MIHTIKINKLMKEQVLQVKVEGVKELKIRIKIASFLFILGAKILGCSIYIDLKENN
jgi:hypothetical protein